MTEHDSVILDNISISIDPASVVENLRMRNMNDKMKTMIDDLVAQVNPVARPKALYRVTGLTDIDDKKMIIGGVEFSHKMKSPVLSVGDMIIPYVVTCGLEVEAIKVQPDDAMKTMKEYCLNVIKTVLVRHAGGYLKSYIQDTYALDNISHISPGEIMGDVSQQRKLFAILGDVEKAIGVTLSPHNLMYPEKTNSGIFFNKTKS